MTTEQRDQLGADYTYKRIFELELDPVIGLFDVAHLKEINRRIFQDLPGAGFNDVTPGTFRKPVHQGGEWMKKRMLSTMPGSFYVAYSPMDEASLQRLEKALKVARPADLRILDTAEFTAQIAQIYIELDYVHPFLDGNSRTLRTFTRQLARESGYDLDWSQFGVSSSGRDILYIARDLGVNQIAVTRIEHELSMKKSSRQFINCKAKGICPTCYRISYCQSRISNRKIRFCNSPTLN